MEGAALNEAIRRENRIAGLANVEREVERSYPANPSLNVTASGMDKTSHHRADDILQWRDALIRDGRPIYRK